MRGRLIRSGVGASAHARSACGGARLVPAGGKAGWVRGAVEGLWSECFRRCRTALGAHLLMWYGWKVTEVGVAQGNGVFLGRGRCGILKLRDIVLCTRISVEANNLRDMLILAG